MQPIPKTIAIIGAGPAGLMAAEVLSAAGMGVCLYERKPSVGRKFLLAGRGGLNLTHSEPLPDFMQKYGDKAAALDKAIKSFTPQDLRNWCEGLGEKTFIGTSRRVFPETFKASPLLRAWIKRLQEQNVRFMLNHYWQGWDQDHLLFQTPEGTLRVKADATLLALGGASWPHLGADGAWMKVIQSQNIQTAPLAPANCGFFVDWSDIFKNRFAGQPLKATGFAFQDKNMRGECIITDKGIEGGAIYALSAALRDEISRSGAAELHLDLKPDLDEKAVRQKLSAPRGALSLSNFLRKTLNLPPVAIGLLMEGTDAKDRQNLTPQTLAARIKDCAVTLRAPFAIDRAISTAGGIAFTALDNNFMLTRKPGVFAAGEMLDWEAPTGGYLLQACTASGVYAAKNILRWLAAD